MKIRLLPAVLCASLLMTACGSDTKPLVIINDSAAPAAVSSSGTTAAPAPAGTDSTESLPPESNIQTDTTTTTTTAPPVPVAVDETLIQNSPIWFSNIKTVSSNEDFAQVVSELDAFVNKWGNKVAFSYMNMDNGQQVQYNYLTRFPTCSTIKAPYVKYVLESGADLDEEVTIGSIWLTAAPEEGHLTGADQGKKYTVRKLIENTLMLSDNTAYNNLVDRFGRYGFNVMLQNIGANYMIYSGYIFTSCSTKDMMLCFKDIYDYAEKDERGKWMVELLENAVFNHQIGAALGDKYPVAQKFGTDNLT